MQALREVGSARLCVSVCVRKRLNVLIKVQTDAVERRKNSQKGLNTQAGYIFLSPSLTLTPPVALARSTSPFHTLIHK